MKKLMLLFIVLCFLSPVSQAANDFSADANCVALWRFENGALTADSKGTNTLTTSGTPVADTVNYKEGAASCDFESAETDYFSIGDASLDAEFPLKNGDVNKNISLCYWIKPESLHATNLYYRAIYFHAATNKNSLYSAIYNDGGVGKFKFGIGYNTGISWEAFTFGPGITLGQWYHVAFTFNNSDKLYKIRIWDDTAGALLGGVEVTAFALNNINVEDAGLWIGRGQTVYTEYADGLIDEMVVFNDILTSDEIDQIRSGTYPSAPPPATGGATVYMGNF